MCEARNFTAYADEICGAGREIYSVKYEIKFHSAAHGDKIYGVVTDNKILGTALAGAGNFKLQNSCVNLRTRNTYEDLKFKGSVNFEPSGGVNFKFKNGTSFRFLCGVNAKSLKSSSSTNALSSSAAARISALVCAGKILNLSAVSRTDIEFKGVGGC